MNSKNHDMSKFVSTKRMFFNLKCDDLDLFIAKNRNTLSCHSKSAKSHTEHITTKKKRKEILEVDEKFDKM